MRMNHSGLVVACFAAFALLSCKDGGQSEALQPYIPTETTGPVPIAMEMRAMDCADLRATARTQAFAEMQQELDRMAEHVATFTCGSLYYDCSDDDDDDSGGGANYSTTLIQEEGVDEPDLIKTDGELIYALQPGFPSPSNPNARSYLEVFTAWPPEATALQSRIRIEGQPGGLLVHGRKVMVITRLMRNEVPTSVAEAMEEAEGSVLYPYAVRLAFYDFTDPANPVELRRLYTQSEFIQARRIGQAAFVVMTNRGFELAPWATVRSDFMNSYWRSEWDIELDYEAAGCELDYCGGAGGEVNENWRREQLSRMAQLKADNLQRLAGWSPKLVPGVYYDRLRPGEDETVDIRPQADCESGPIWAPTQDSTWGMVNVLTFDLQRPDKVMHRTSVMADGYMLYMSPSRLWLAQWLHSPGGYQWMNGSVAYWLTGVRSFSLDAGAFDLEYEAGGVIYGWVPGSYAMSEYEGYLRAVSTDGGWGRGSTRVSVLERKGDRLELAGEVSGIAPGESVYATRFLGPRGFLVTFLQIDPLFTLDLADPYQPRVVGELEIPGFSTHLHPLDENHLLAIGQGGDESFFGVQLSIFDVSDMAAPTLKHRTNVGVTYSDSPALYDPKALTFHPTQPLLALPVRTGHSSNYAQTYQIDTDAGITLERQFNHPSEVIRTVFSRP